MRSLRWAAKIVALAAASACLVVGSSTAQQAGSAKTGQSTSPRAPWELWSVEKMINLACDQIARRYSLTPQQDTYTRALMTRRVKAFLDQHEDELRALLSEAWAARLANEPPTAEMAKDWAERAKPIFEAAKAQILEGNKQWREVLNDEQKKIHDIDMKLMRTNFGITQERLDRWASGKFDPEREWRRGGLVGALAGGGAADRSGRSRISRGPGGVVRSEDYWQLYVRRFISNYQLDANQAETARSILRECRQRAAEYRKGRKEQFEQAVAAVRRALAAKPRDAAAIRQAYTHLRELNRPINELFKELRRRLEEIPTQAQKQAYQKARQERTARLRKQWQERRARMARKSTTTTAAGPTTRPWPTTMPVAR
ncbi:MAG: hypothetical protein ACE5K7_04685 [Phycisphaerae bacterium]